MSSQKKLKEPTAAERASMEKILLSIEKGEGVTFNAPELKATSLNTGWWSEADLIKNLEGTYVPSYKDWNMEHMCIRFFNFYLFGTLSKGTSAVATIMDPILSYESKGQLMFKPRDVETQWFTENPNEAASWPNLELKVSPNEFPSTITEEMREDYAKLLNTYSESDAQKFLDRIKGYASDPAGIDVLRRLALILALTSLRITVKEEVAVRLAYRKKQYRQNLAVLAKWGVSDGFAPPHDGFVSGAHMSFTGNNVASSRAFTLLTHCYRHSFDTDYYAILGAAVMTHTARNGMNLISLLALTTNVLGTTISNMLPYFCNQSTMKSWQKINEFLNTCCKIPKEDAEKRKVPSWMWARLIDDSKNKDLSCKDHRALAFMFAGAVKHHTGDGIFTAEWSKNELATHQPCVERGMIVLMAFRPAKVQEGFLKGNDLPGLSERQPTRARPVQDIDDDSTDDDMPKI